MIEGDRSVSSPVHRTGRWRVLLVRTTEVRGGWSQDRGGPGVKTRYWSGSRLVRLFCLSPPLSFCPTSSQRTGSCVCHTPENGAP